MAFNRMNGTNPDFRPYGERSGTYMNATVFDKPAVLTREIARFEGMFRSFDLDRTYVMRIGVPLRQYDGERQGYAIGFGESSQVGLSDPVTYHSYALGFRNADELSFLRVGDSMAARNFAQRYGFSTQGDSAGSAGLEIAYRLVDAPPRLGGGADTVRADILAARLVTQSGQLIYDFGTTKAFSEGTTRGADGMPGAPMLKAVDIQGFRTGMPMAEADGLGTRGWKVKLGGQGDQNTAIYYNGLAVAAGRPLPDWGTCGNIELGVPDFSARSMGGGLMPDFADCVAVQAARQPGAPDTVEKVSTEQFLQGAEPAALLTALRAKYGPPTYVRNDGTNLVWVGRNPAQPDGDQVQVTADVRRVGEATATRTRLSVAMQPYVDPTPKPPPRAPVAAGPKL